MYFLNVSYANKKLKLKINNWGYIVMNTSVKGITQHVLELVQEDVEANFLDYISTIERKEYNKQLKKVCMIQDKLTSKLPEEYRELIDEYESQNNSLTSLYSNFMFNIGIKIGAAMYNNTVPNAIESKVLKQLSLQSDKSKINI